MQAETEGNGFVNQNDARSLPARENSELPETHIAAPEIRSRPRSQDEDIVLLQSTFTQTLPDLANKESKKACHSVAVQTQFQSDFEAPTYSVITGDGGVAYDSDGVRVLRAIGTWTPNYQGSEQFVQQNGEVYMNASAAVTSSESPIVQHAVTTTPTPSSVTNCLPSASATRVVTTQNTLPDPQDAANKQPAGDKAFVCPVCSKGLARKDKLVIHMRIHTGEKPYVCEICERAFARRDKLVMHMNKLKHLTPSNIAPLGKRHHSQSPSGLSSLPEKRHDIKLEVSYI